MLAAQGGSVVAGVKARRGLRVAMRGRFPEAEEFPALRGFAIHELGLVVVHNCQRATATEGASSGRMEPTTCLWFTVRERRLCAVLLRRWSG